MSDKLRFGNDDDDAGGAYEPTDSEDEYSEEEKQLLTNVRKGRKRADDGKMELMAFDESSDDDEDDNGDGDDDDDDNLMHDSDIEGKGDDDDDGDNQRDDMDWGNKSRNYYNTDFVDNDYSSYNVQEEDLALAEEEEAKKIQLRLAKQLKDADFGLESLQADFAIHKTTQEDEDDEEDENKIKVKTDLLGLTQRERLQLFLKDSPEFHGLTHDFTNYLTQVETLLKPVTEHVRENKTPIIPALEFTSLYENLLMTYCSNVAFYVLLKAKRITVKHHPIIKRLVQLRQLLQQLKDKYDNIIKPQLEALLERIMDGDKFEVIVPAAKEHKAAKNRLKIMDEYDEAAVVSKKEHKKDSNAATASSDSDDDDDNADEDAIADVENIDEQENARRGITYQIAKNKGLTPHRKKEQRNPRVKHRGKYRKALVRRKGAVRTVRKETQRYGGEISGIKSTVTKSVKFKS